MKTIVLAVLALAGVAASVPLDHTHGAHEMEYCGSPQPSDAAMDVAEGIVARFRDRVCDRVGAARLPRLCGDAKDRAVLEKIVIPVVAHVLYDPATGRGNISDATVQEQMRVMNEDYAGRDGSGFDMDFRYNLVDIIRTGNEQWFSRMVLLEDQYKSALAVDVETTLNIYFGEPGGGVVGMCYFAFMHPADSHMHGCLVHYDSVPGGGLEPYNLGACAAHEVGHHHCLYHTFQSECNRGDRVDDTPTHVMTRGCPIPAPDTCGDGQPDPIHNHMNYSDDMCRDQFTAGQSERATQFTMTFHPGYFSEETRIIREAFGAENPWEEARIFQMRGGN